VIKAFDNLEMRCLMLPIQSYLFQELSMFQICMQFDHDSLSYSLLYRHHSHC
jgi:hypothetical protein